MIVLKPPITHPFAERKVVLMSGLSQPESCQLSQVQISFLERLETSSEEIVRANFPFIDESQVDFSEVSLLKASLNNSRQYLAAWKNPYRNCAIQHWQSIVESCHELIVITLSCGLEILNVCCSSGIFPEKINIVALGPVARKRPEAPHRLIRGSRDYVSFPFFRSVDTLLPEVGHMNYLESEEVFQIVNKLLIYP